MRLRQENHLNLRGRGCSEPRLCHCTPAWATKAKLCLKKEKRTKSCPLQQYVCTWSHYPKQINAETENQILHVLTYKFSHIKHWGLMDIKMGTINTRDSKSGIGRGKAEKHVRSYNYCLGNRTSLEVQTSASHNIPM